MDFFHDLTVTDEDFHKLVQFIQKNYGIDLSKKRALITSRLSHSLKERGYTSMKPFLEHLFRTKSQEDLELVLNKLTTNYTYFLREKDHFTYLTNTILPQLAVARQRERKEKFRSVMDGTVVLDRGMKQYGSLIVFVFVLGLVVITNSYLSEKVARESARIKTELKELQYRQISAKAEWMRLSRQSSVARMLDGTGVTESKVPPFKVLVPEPERKAWWSPKKLGRHPKDEDK